MFIALLQKYLPPRIKNALGEVVYRNIALASYIKAKIYISRIDKKTLIFGKTGQVLNCLTFARNSLSDIRFSEPKFRYIPDNTIDVIIVNDFLQIFNQIELETFFQECSRILKRNGIFKISYTDFELLSEFYRKKIIKNGGSLESDDTFRKSTSEILSNASIDFFNQLLFRKYQTRTLIDQEKIYALLALYGFTVVDVKTAGLKRTVIAKKRILEELFSKIAIRLPTMQEINSATDWPAYLGFCDPLWITNRFTYLSSETKKKLRNRTFFSVIGSMFFINLLPYLEPKKLFLFDISEFQVRQMKVYTELIKISNSYEDFLENIFSRRFTRDLDKFIKQEVDPEIYARTEKLITDKEAFQATIGKIASASPFPLSSDITALKIRDNSMCQSITMLAEDRFKPGPGTNTFYYNSLLCESFPKIKKLLTSASISVAGLDSKEVMDTLQNDNGVIYVSNIGEENWLEGKYTDESIESVAASGKQLSKAFQKQWTDSYIGFKSFLDKVHSQFWLIDSAGNIFNSVELLMERSDSHLWLWQSLQPHLKGEVLEIIHAPDGTWGFNEHLKTRNWKSFLNAKPDATQFQTVVLHILMGNGLQKDEFLQVLNKAGSFAQRVIIIEHYTLGKNHPSTVNTYADELLCLISSARLVSPEIKIFFSGTTTRDTSYNGHQKELLRNIVIVCDL